MDSRTKVFRAHRALAWFYAFIGLSILGVMFATIGVTIVMLPVFLVCGAIFSAHFFTARACADGKDGGRIASIVIACVMLVGFPVGTIIGIYLLINTRRPWALQPQLDSAS